MRREFALEFSRELSKKHRENKERNSCFLLALLLHNTVFVIAFHIFVITFRTFVIAFYIFVITFHTFVIAFHIFVTRVSKR